MSWHKNAKNTLQFGAHFGILAASQFFSNFVQITKIYIFAELLIYYSSQNGYLKGGKHSLAQKKL